MKIALVPGGELRFSPNLIDSPYSVALICFLLGEELIKRGHEVTLFVTSDSKISSKIASNWMSSSYIKKYFKTDKARTKLLEIYLQNIISQAKNFDVIHIHEVFLGVIRSLKKLKNPPVIATFHNPLFYKKDKNLKKFKFIAISQSQIKNNSDFNFIGKAPNGLSVNLYSFNERPKDYLFWIGRICPQKGVLEAIKVAKETKRKLLIAGGFSKFPYHLNYIKRFKEEIRKNKNVKYLGEIKNLEQKVEYLKNAFCLLAPIKWEEPFGLVLVEAMACGTPVIAFKRGAVPEIVRDGITGFVVKNQNEMIKAVKKIEGIDRRKCRQWVEENFTVEKMVDGYEKIYKEVIEKHKNNL